MDNTLQVTAETPLLLRLLNSTVLPSGPYGNKLALLSAIDALGSGMFLAGSAVYFTRVVGLPAASVGFALSVAGVLGFLAAVPVGMLADRLGAGRVYVVVNLWRAGCYVAYCFCDHYLPFFITACAIGLVETSAAPINQAVVGSASSDENRLANMAKVRSVRNVGYGLGALISIVAISSGSRASFVAVLAANAASFAFAAVLLASGGFAELSATSSATPKRSLVTDVRYLLAAGCNGILAVHLTLLPFVFPLWIAQHTRLPIAYYGGLYALNTVLAITLQARMSRRADRLAGAAASALLASVALAGFAALAIVLGQVRILWLAVVVAVLATVALTFGEMWQSASGWSISYLLARPDRRSQYLSTFQLGTSAQSIVAPWLLARFVLPGNDRWSYLIAVVLAAGAGTWLLVSAKPGAHRARSRT